MAEYIVSICLLILANKAAELTKDTKFMGFITGTSVAIFTLYTTIQIIKIFRNFANFS